MRLLLDTHVLLWWLAGRSLAEDVEDAITDSETDVAVSAATAWEISIKKALGKLSVPDDLAEQLDRNGMTHLPITVRHAMAAGALPRHHDDPFDRMLVAQAQIEGWTLVSRDSRLSAYDVSLLRA